MKKLKLEKNSYKVRPLFLTIAVFVALGGFFASNTLVGADQFEDQIRQLNQQNDVNRQNVRQLQLQANTYQEAITQLQSQISALQKQINDNEEKRDDLQRQIEAAQAELDRQKQVLGQSVKAMYLESKISTIEMLAASRDISEFVDKEQYRYAVQNNIKDTLVKINELKLKLYEQKNQIEQLLNEQSALQGELSYSRNQQTELLAYTQAQKASFQQSIKDNNAKINDLRRQQALANARNSIGGRVGSPSNGYYPYAGWPFSMRLGPGCVDGDGPDRWGYCTRQCVSYAAWAVERSGRNAPRYYGDAKNWVNAGSRYIVSTPQPGDVAVSTAGTWGHVMYVEAVGEKNGRDAVYISQYNAGLQGEYSEEWKYASSYTYLRFP